MTDLELTKACAEAMGYLIDTAHEEDFARGSGIWCHLPKQHGEWYRPLSGDLYGNAQAMALVKRFVHRIHFNPALAKWHACWLDEYQVARFEGWNADLNRAICECVAKIKP